MPEMQELLSLIEKLRLGVPQHNPRQLAQMLADIARTHYVERDISTLQTVLGQVILERYGVTGFEEFLQELRKRR